MVPLDITNIDDTILNNTNKNLYNDGEARQGNLFKDITKLYEEDKSDVMLNERSRYEDRKRRCTDGRRQRKITSLKIIPSFIIPILIVISL